MSSPFAQAALAYARLGYGVFPCQQGRKQPACAHGVKEATTDQERIRQWWAKNPHYNIGLSANELLIIDIDPGGLSWPGPERAAEIKQLAPPLQRTPRGGWHIVFRRPHGVQWRCTAGQLARGVDTRTDGGYILVGPSRTEHGQYRWVRPLRPIDQLPFPPDWLARELDHLGQPCQRPADPFAPLEGPIFPEGQRNVGLTRYAGKLRALGFGPREIEEILLLANRLRCRPPLPVEEVRRIAKSIARYPAGSPRRPKWRGNLRSVIPLGG